jgi:hypothetical protein
MTAPKHNLGILLNATQVGEMLNITSTTVGNYHRQGLLPAPVDAPQFKSPRWTLSTIEKFIVAGGIEAAKKEQELAKKAAAETNKITELTAKEYKFRREAELSLRDIIAIDAMAALIGQAHQQGKVNTIKYYTTQAYWWADAMIESREPVQEELPLND